MNPLILKFADGTMFFAGLITIGLVGLALILLRGRRKLSRLVVPLLISVIFVALSPAPLPPFVHALWLLCVAFSLYLLVRAQPTPRAHVATGVLLLAPSMVAGYLELPFLADPTISISRHQTLYVLGDSISAGMGTGEKCWPLVLGDLTELNVINLAQAGATTDSAATQAAQIKNENSLVIVEIGGNDLLGPTSAADFRKQLERLVSSLSQQHHDILMFELPLPPFCYEFGRAQRDIASRYGVKLLSKRHLTQVLAMDGSTLDGLHLAQKGHNTLAEVVSRILQIN